MVCAARRLPAPAPVVHTATRDDGLAETRPPRPSPPQTRAGKCWLSTCNCVSSINSVAGEYVPGIIPTPATPNRRTAAKSARPVGVNCCEVLSLYGTFSHLTVIAYTRLRILRGMNANSAICRTCEFAPSAPITNFGVTHSPSAQFSALNHRGGGAMPPVKPGDAQRHAGSALPARLPQRLLQDVSFSTI